jgi:N-acetylmuramoyl-L-alanine amidase
MDKLTMSSGHSLRCRGAAGFLDEVNEARRVVEQVTKYLRQLGVIVNVFHDNASTSQNTNLKTIVAHHNRTVRDLDISVHFNASGGKGTGSEVFYYDKKELATGLSKVIANALGIKDRGAKNGKGLYFVKSTKKPALLLEICFVDNKADEQAYNKNFDKMCRAIAEYLAGKKLPTAPTKEPVQKVEETPVVQSGDKSTKETKKEEAKVNTSKLPVSEQFKDEVAQAIKKGITNGDRPQDLAKREEVMVMVKRAVEKADKFEDYQLEEMYKEFAKVKDKLLLQKVDEWETKLKEKTLTVSEAQYLMFMLMMRSFA